MLLAFLFLGPWLQRLMGPFCHWILVKMLSPIRPLITAHRVTFTDEKNMQTHALYIINPSNELHEFQNYTKWNKSNRVSCGHMRSCILPGGWKSLILTWIPSSDSHNFINWFIFSSCCRLWSCTWGLTVLIKTPVHHTRKRAPKTITGVKWGPGLAISPAIIEAANSLSVQL